MCHYTNAYLCSMLCVCCIHWLNLIKLMKDTYCFYCMSLYYYCLKKKYRRLHRYSGCLRLLSCGGGREEGQERWECIYTNACKETYECVQRNLLMPVKRPTNAAKKKAKKDFFSFFVSLFFYRSPFVSSFFVLNRISCPPFRVLSFFIIIFYLMGHSSWKNATRRTCQKELRW